MWPSNHCPSCQITTEDTDHVLHCLELSHGDQLSTQIVKLEETLVSKKVPPLTIATMLDILFQTCYPLAAGIQPSSLLRSSQNTISAQKWELLSTHWKQQLGLFNQDPTKQHLTLHWVAILLQQLWNMAWDLWQYCNG